jgi:predicted transcriptional regulator
MLQYVVLFLRPSGEVEVMAANNKKESSPKLRFEPDRQGLEAVMGPLEARVMEIVWETGEVTVREVWRRINAEGETAYTTVMTIFHRLYEKGYLERRSQGRAHVYFPKETRKQFQEGFLSRVVRGVLEQARGSGALGMLGKLKKNERALLRKMLEESEG